MQGELVVPGPPLRDYDLRAPAQCGRRAAPCRPRACAGVRDSSCPCAEWAPAPNKCSEHLGLGRILQRGAIALIAEIPHSNADFVASACPCPRALQAGGRRFDSGWLHRRTACKRAGLSMCDGSFSYRDSPESLVRGAGRRRDERLLRARKRADASGYSGKTPGSFSAHQLSSRTQATSRRSPASVSASP